MAVLLFLLQAVNVFAQEQINLPLNRYLNLEVDRVLARIDTQSHTSMKPYIGVSADSINSDFRYNPKTWLMRKAFVEHLIRYTKDDFTVVIDPLIDFGGGLTQESLSLGSAGGVRSLYTNTRGVRAAGRIGSKVSFETIILESLVTPPFYVDSATRVSQMPGWFGLNNNSKTVIDLSMYMGHISYSPSKHFNFQLGHDRNFIGDGYRSLLLSDNASPYPFVKITTNVGPIRYTNLYMQYVDNKTVVGNNQLGKQKKFGIMHYLDIALGKRVNVGLFQSEIMGTVDSLGNTRSFEFNYLNPIAFLPFVEFTMGSPDNSMLGANVKVKINSRSSIYGQFALDEFRASEIFKQDGWRGNKYGIQLGFKSFDFLKIPRLSMQVEANAVRPYTYSHWGPQESYTHNSQALAHPMGANFYELLAIFNYRKDRWYGQFKMNYYVVGTDIKGLNYGRKPELNYNVGYVSEYNNEIGQGLKNTLFLGDLRAGYIFNRSNNSRLEASFSYRSQENVYNTRQEVWFMISISTMLSNYYHDF